jgi:hypothetical protein
MRTETHSGCKIKVRAGRGATWGQMSATVNGQPFPVVEKFNEDKAISEIKRTLDHVHSAPIDGDRWPASYYAPGTYELCDEGIHPREIGGTCTHSTCQPGRR